jgi:hybrid cluster-associated redox disulfide protein
MKKQNKNKKQEINKKMSFSEILEKFPEAAETLFESGMHCCGCPMSASESLEQGAMAHGIDADKLVEKLNKKPKKIKR